MRSIVAAAVGVAVGIWMMLAPAVLGYSGSAATSDRIVGPTAAAVAWIAASEATRSIRWVNVPLGLWLVVSPLVLNPPASATLHVIVSGIALVASAIALAPMPADEYGGGWRALTEQGDGGGT